MCDKMCEPCCNKQEYYRVRVEATLKEELWNEEIKAYLFILNDKPMVSKYKNIEYIIEGDVYDIAKPFRSLNNIYERLTVKTLNNQMEK